MNRIATTLLASAAALSATPQYNLTAAFNLPVDGDRVPRITLEDTPEPVAGYDMLWDFSGLATGSEHHRVVHHWLGDTLLITENRERDILLLDGDTLYTVGHRSPAKKMDYALPETALVFPEGYGGAMGGLFYSEGVVDQANYMRQTGHASSSVVGYGRMITPDCDSLRHVLLVRTERHGSSVVTPDFGISFDCRADSAMLSADSIGRWLVTDSVTHRLVTHRWYARGYRYPVVETGALTVYRFGTQVDSVEVAWYTPPVMQETELQPDAPNDSLRTLNRMEPFWPASPPPYGGGSPGGCIQPGLMAEGSSCLFTPTVVGDNAIVTYAAAEPCMLSVAIHSAGGALLWQSARQVDAGAGTVPVDTSQLPTGTHVATVVVGSDVFSFKIFRY